MGRSFGGSADAGARVMVIGEIAFTAARNCDVNTNDKPVIANIARKAIVQIPIARCNSQTHPSRVAADVDDEATPPVFSAWPPDDKTRRAHHEDADGANPIHRAASATAHQIEMEPLDRLNERILPAAHRGSRH